MNKAEKRYQETLNKLNSGKRVSPYTVMRLKCLDCMCFQEDEVRKCPAKDCILWKYRMGKNPFPKKISEEQKKKMAERLKKAREK